MSHPCFCVLLTATTSIKTKAELTKKVERQNKINKLTPTVSLDRRGFGWRRTFYHAVYGFIL